MGFDYQFLITYSFLNNKLVIKKLKEMEKTNQKKRKGRKSSVEKIYLSSEELIKIIEMTIDLRYYPIWFTHIYQLYLDFISKHFYNHKWKLKLKSIDEINGRFQYGFSTIEKIDRLYFDKLNIELEEKFVLNLIDECNT